MKLFDAVWAPSPRRVRIYLSEKGIDVPRETIDIRTGDHESASYVAVNPRKLVPALLLDDGTLIDDSVGICRYFEALHPDPPLFGHTPTEAGLVESWIRRIESDLYTPVTHCFRNRHSVFADKALSGEWPPIPQIPALIDRGQTMWNACLDAIDAHLAGKAYLFGDAFSFADIMALVAIDFGIATKMPDPLGRPHIARWHALVSARPSAAA
jgi:glutathione S-transferase